MYDLVGNFNFLILGFGVVVVIFVVVEGSVVGGGGTVVESR